MTKTREAKYCIGQSVIDPQFRYRGVIIDVDLCFSGEESWYEINAPHRPEKNQPWYHVLVHDSNYRAYAGESSLEPDLSGELINHPEVDYFFVEFKNGLYILRKGYNI